MELKNYLLTCQQRANQALDAVLPSVKREPHALHQAMRYAVLNGGKRVRSALIYATGEALNANASALDHCSAAIELVHAFSLVHDDLPAIDNDDLRRGKPACHVAFDEATAILAGDALLVLAFEVLTNLNKQHISPPINLHMIKILSHYVGSLGMAGGEALDTALKDQQISLRKLAFIYKLKTSYLICASILLGALCANCDDATIIKNLEKFGLYMGLAFQIHDDIIGVESDSTVLGKPQGSDVTNHKPTFPQLIGIKKAKLKEQECFDLALDYLQKSGIKSEKLLALGEFIIDRKF